MPIEIAVTNRDEQVGACRGIAACNLVGRDHGQPAKGALLQ
jgi:hypothetical protein